MKTCSICKEEKTLDCYNKNRGKKDGLNTICRECSNARSKQYYASNSEHHKKVIAQRNRCIRKNNRSKLDAFKVQGCSLCNEKDVCCLDFHHVSEDKDYAVSNMVGLSWKKILEEISKCILVCANCHRKLHAGKLKI